MSDLDKYISKRKNHDIDFAVDFDEGFAEFKLSETIKQLRKEAGISQEELAHKLHTQKTAISRLENHSEDILLSTLFKIAHALGKKVDINFVDQ
jgi:DNA-binding XRE family transcriptional regulator